MALNQAAEDFRDGEMDLLDERTRRFANMREMLMDVLIEIERNGEENRFAHMLKKRVLASRSESELEMAMNALLVISRLRFEV